jgi:hypothetical protein
VGKTLEEELPERAQELRMRTVAHLQYLYENRHNLKMGTLLQKILAVMTRDEIDNYNTPPPFALPPLLIRRRSSTNNRSRDDHGENT